MKSLREVGGVRLRGGVGELWARGCKAGLVYDWTFEGWQGEWQLEAERYKLDPLLMSNGYRDVRIKLDTAAGHLEGTGTVWTDYTADGHSHRAIIIKGRSLTWQRKRAAPATVRD